MITRPTRPGLLQDLAETFRKPSVNDLKARQLDSHQRALLQSQHDHALAQANVTIYAASCSFHTARIASLAAELAAAHTAQVNTTMAEGGPA